MLSVFAYAFIFGVGYAVGFVLLIFVHEIGHYLVARQRGLDVGAPMFIPFVGAWIQLNQLPHDVDPNAPENVTYYNAFILWDLLFGVGGLSVRDDI